jgi:hypothetical protein
LSAFGKFVEIAFANGVAPAINETNLNEMERVLALTDEELRRRQTLKLSDYIQYFWQRNCKQIESFQDDTEWTAAASTTCDEDTTNNIIGRKAVKMIESDNTGSWIGIYKNIASLDLTKFNDGSASAIDDCILIVFYITDITKFTYFQFKLGDDNSNNYSIASNPAGFNNGWNCLAPQKSDFTTNGAPSGWDDITYIRIEAISANNAQNEYFSLQLLSLYRQDPDYAGYFNPFQKYDGSSWENLFDITFDYWGLYWDNHNYKLGFMHLNPYAQTYSYVNLHIYCSILAFIAKMEFYCKKDGEGASITWVNDDDNYISIFIDSDTFYMDINEAGVLTTISNALTNALKKHDRYEVYFEKNIQEIRAILKRNGEAISILEYETSISATAEGCIYLGHDGDSGFSMITDFVIANTQGHSIEKDNFIVTKGDYEDRISDNSLSNDNDLYCYLEANSMYIINLHLAVVAASSTPRIKIAWSHNGTGTIYRNVIGPAYATSDVGDTNVKMSNYNDTSSIPYGVDGSANESYIQENLFCITGDEGLKLNLQWAQNVSDTDYTRVLGRSFMEIKKVNTLK